MPYDLAVIGSGAAGFAAAIAARAAGRDVVMIEQGTVGGTCVNTGCVPSKALLAAAETRHVALEQHFPGIHTSASDVDVRQLIAGKRDLVQALRTAKYTDLAADHDWDILPGIARFTATDSGPLLEIDRAQGDKTIVAAEHYLISTGSAPWLPPIEGLETAGYLTSTTAMDLDTLPRSMVVLGGNAVGLEQAQLWHRLGVEVTVVEALPRLAPFDEPEISGVLADAFRDEGIQVLLSATVSQVDRDAAGYQMVLTGADRGPDVLRADQLLLATGRRPVTAGLNLDLVGVKTGTRGEVLVDEYQRTSHPRIWAAGDVTGSPQFVYVAAAQGKLVADNAFDEARRTLDYQHLPRVTFTSPAVASVGLTDAEAVEQGHICECRVLPLEYVPRAVVNRDTRGLIKLVADRETGRLLGAHVVARSAGEVIASAVYALANQMTVQQMAELWCPYLTMAEGLKLTAQTFTRDVAKLSCCAS